ncbi:MAG: GNAT family N-acetyltransferase [Clostridia bacterium]|nr:GNAT family N-acetyltransferase [Clostridia bacterium]
MKTLITERLKLREWTMEDAPDLFEYAQNPRVGLNAGWYPHTSLRDSEEYISLASKAGDVWAIEHIEQGKVIGGIGLHAGGLRKADWARELGYVLSEAYWGRGLMSEAVNAVLKFGFEELELKIISVRHFNGNDRSRRVIQKSGFRFEGVASTALFFDGRVIDEWCYSITCDEWRGKRGRPIQNHRFYQNLQCEFFPCHPTEDAERFSCQFCYCPLYAREDCGGCYVVLENGIKDCSRCLKPHYDYDGIVKRLR